MVTMVTHVANVRSMNMTAQQISFIILIAIDNVEPMIIKPVSDTVCGCVVLIPSSSCSCMRGTTHTHNDVLTTHHQLLILSAVSCSPILCSAALNTVHEGTPFCGTLSCCCSHAESISILHSLGLLRRYVSISVNIG